MAATDIITLFEAKRYLAMDQQDTTKDGELSTYVTSVSEAIDGHAGPVVKRTIADELHDGGGSLIMLKHYPVSSVVTVTDYWGTTATVLTAEVLGAASTANQYKFNPANGLIRRRSYGLDDGFSPSDANVKVTYIAGRYTNTQTVAEHYKLAACLCLADLWKSTMGGGNVSYGSYESEGEHKLTYVIPYQAQALIERRAPVVV